MNKKKILVTGGLGFIGSNLIEKLLEEWLIKKLSDHILLEYDQNPDKYNLQISQIYFDHFFLLIKKL